MSDHTVVTVLKPYVFTSHTMSVMKSMPGWFQSGDLIVKRGRRTFMVSMTQTEPRWQAILKRLKRRLAHK